MVKDTSRSTAMFCSPLMYSFVTSRAISMSEEILALASYRAVGLVAAFAGMIACRTDGNSDSVRNSSETKDNMSITKGTVSAGRGGSREAAANEDSVGPDGSAAQLWRCLYAKFSLGLYGRGEEGKHSAAAVPAERCGRNSAAQSARRSASESEWRAHCRRQHMEGVEAHRRAA